MKRISSLILPHGRGSDPSHDRKGVVARRTSALIGLTLMVFCSFGLAQDTNGERVVVPARDTTHARKVDVSVMGGSITVKGYPGKEVIVEAGGGRHSRRDADRAPDGMRRLDLPERGLSVEEANNVVTVRMQNMQQGDLVISVPPDTSLKLRNLNGAIEVEGVKGELDVNSNNGRITLTNVSGSVLANTLNGALTVTMDSVDPNKPLSFSSLNGTIDVPLRQSLKGPPNRPQGPRRPKKATLLQQPERHHRRHPAGRLQGQREAAHR